MDNEVKEFLAALQKKLVSIDYIKTEDIPNIGLYMDQVTTFMDEQLEACKRYEDDKILTKTMINNYAKNNLLPAPEINGGSLPNGYFVWEKKQECTMLIIS